MNEDLTHDELIILVKLLGTAFWQMDARFSALKTIVGELHPDQKERLEALIQSNTRENLKQFETLRKTLEFLQASVSGPVQ
jgi:hypothetical protein